MTPSRLRGLEDPPTSCAPSPAGRRGRVTPNFDLTGRAHHSSHSSHSSHLRASSVATSTARSESKPDMIKVPLKPGLIMADTS